MSVVKLTSSRFKINLGFLSLESNWEVDDIQKNAAWEMYIELVTGVSTVELVEGEGLLREALNSMYSLFKLTRGILRKYGPSIATAQNPNDITFGHLAVGILNKVLRPTLTKWHPVLLDWEERKPAQKSVTEHEAEWEHNAELRIELSQIRIKLVEYANVLGEVSGVADLLD